MEELEMNKYGTEIAHLRLAREAGKAGLVAVSRSYVSRPVLEDIQVSLVHMPTFSFNSFFRR